MQIARLNAMLTATAKGFESVFKSAGSSVQTFGSQFASVRAKISAIGGVIGAGAVAYEIISLTKASFDSVDALKDQAEAIGVSVESLSRLQYAAKFAGVDAGTMSSAVGKMVKSLGEAAISGGPVADAIEQIGLDAKALSGMAPEQAFAKIAGAIAAIENPYQRAQAASAIFGKQWQSLAPVLNKGEAGLAGLATESDRLGATVNSVDAAKIEMANDAVDRLGAFITGVANKIAAELSPYITVIADKLVSVGTEGVNAGSIVTTAIEMVAKGIAYATDYLELFKAGWYSLKAGVLAVAGGFIKSIDLIGQGLVALANLIPGVEMEWTSSFSEMADSFASDAVQAADEAGKAWDKFSSGENSAAVGAFFDEVRTKANEAAAAAAKAAQAPPPIPLDNLEDEDKAQKEAAKRYEEMEKAAKQYYDATRTPAEKYAAEIERINELLLSGALDPDTAQRAADAAAKTLKEATKGAQTQIEATAGPGLLQAGSVELSSLVARSQRDQFAQDTQKQMVDEQQTTNETLAAIKAANEKLADTMATVELI